MSGKARKWRGTWEILPRRKQVPSPEYSSRDVVVTILKALKNSVFSNIKSCRTNISYRVLFRLESARTFISL